MENYALPSYSVLINSKNAHVKIMNSYLLFKSLHLIAVISWMAGLLYLPRIFVYHSENSNEIITDVFKTMERKLFYFIMTPAMVLSWLFGLILVHEIGFPQTDQKRLEIKPAAKTKFSTHYVPLNPKREGLPAKLMK